MGPQFTYELIDDVKQRVSRNELSNAREIKKVLQERMDHLLQKMDGPFEIFRNQPFIIMTIGVNGSGENDNHRQAGRHAEARRTRHRAGCCDTFRAAAVEQLEVWANGWGPLLSSIKQIQTGGGCF
jgi:fused signal recognition particle receptor